MTKRISPRVLLLALILFSTHQITNAQQPEPTIEYGSPADLRGVKSIYVYTGTDIDVRNNIVKEITKKLKDIVVANTPSEAEVCLVFGTDFSTFYAGSSTSGTVTVDSTDTARVQTRSTPKYRKVTYGSGAVVIIKPNNVVRVIMNFEDAKGEGPPAVTLFERKPSTNFARAFVKAYKEANPEEKKK